MLKRNRNRNKQVFTVETLEDRIALSAFGQAVASQAGPGFGEHQSDAAHALGGLGAGNRNDGYFKAPFDTK